MYNVGEVEGHKVLVLSIDGKHRRVAHNKTSSPSIGARLFSKERNDKVSRRFDEYKLSREDEPSDGVEGLRSLPTVRVRGEREWGRKIFGPIFYFRG